MSHASTELEKVVESDEKEDSNINSKNYKHGHKSIPSSNIF